MAFVFDMTRFGMKDPIKFPDETDLLAQLNNMILEDIRKQYAPQGIKEAILSNSIVWDSAYLKINPCLRSFLGLLPVAYLRMWQAMFTAWIAQYTLARVLAETELQKVEWLSYRPGAAIVALYQEAKTQAIAWMAQQVDGIQQAYLQNISPEDRDNIREVTSQLSFENVSKNCPELMKVLTDIMNKVQGTLADVESIIFQFSKVTSLYNYLKILVYYIDAKKSQLVAWESEVADAIEAYIAGEI